jgi:hypothetical protein
MKKAVFVFTVLFISSCTEEARNKISRSVSNIVGERLKVSYIDEGVVVKTWTVADGKITSGDKGGVPIGYYYFWSEETGYVQIPIERTIIEEIRK